MQNNVIKTIEIITLILIWFFFIFTGGFVIIFKYIIHKWIVYVCLKNYINVNLEDGA